MSRPTRIGICFGCFIPLHRGHMAMIEQARAENDRIVIGVTGHDMDRGYDTVPFLRRVRLMERLYAIPGKATVAEVDDRAIGLTGTFSEEAWKTWCDELFYRAGLDPKDPENKYAWYSGEAGYIEKIRASFPWHGFVRLDRSAIPVSGTAIREDPLAHADEIHPAFLEYMETHPKPKGN